MDEPGWDSGPAATIMLADDHAVVRAAVRLVLEASGFEIVAEVGALQELRRKLRAYKPQVLVLDLGMPEGSSLGEIPALLQSSPGTQIVVLTMETDHSIAHEALRGGARAFVLKESADTELLAAIRAVIDGRLWLDPGLGARIASEPDRHGPPDHLGARELEVLALIGLGHTNREIAEMLFLSVRTVESHRSHIEHKVGLRSRAELVRYARDHGLLDE